jgi:LmbE family N-acetylglucosaminyl deacetylase
MNEHRLNPQTTQMECSLGPKAAGLAAVLVLWPVLAAEAPAQPGEGYGLAETLEAIERARVTTRILYVTAHPDDEPSGVLTYLARGLGADVALLSVTRGEGGQNALGPELGARLAILRSEELLAATRRYGVKLFFTRAPDFGYSKTAEESLAVWGEAALGDMVAVIRRFRPHIVVNNWGGVRTGHGQHQAAGLLTPQALEAAGDDKKFPEQIAAGLKPWRASHLLQITRGNPAPEGIRIASDEISPVWGKSYNEIGLEGFVNHRTQGVVGFRGSPFFRGSRTLTAPEGAKLTAEGLSRALRDLQTYSDRETQVLGEVDRLLLEGHGATQKLRFSEAVAKLASAARRIQERPFEDSARGEFLWELRRAAERMDEALRLAAGLRVEAQADRGELVAGETFTVDVTWQQRKGVPVALGNPELLLPEGWSIAKQEGVRERAVRFTVAIPAGAKPPVGEDDWMLPEAASLVRARIRATVEGYSFSVEAPVTAQRVTSTRVDELPLVLVPAVTLTPEPQQFIVAEKQPAKPLELLVRVHHYGRAAASVVAGVEAPRSWSVAPITLRVEFSGPGDQLVRFVATPPARPVAGSYELKPYAKLGEQRFETSVEALPTLPTRLFSEPATVHARVFDLAVPPNLRVGYVAAENDPVPEALRQIGVQVELLDEVALAFGDLARFDAICIGIRAYELRRDLARSNRRLLDYAAAGGTLVVQYQRDEWDAQRSAPYPATLGRPTVRVAVEDAPVRFLAPQNPALNFPNKIAAADFNGWVQERGLYFWSQFDARYTPLLGMADPGEQETTGSLVWAQHGKGTYIYTGLSFFRQLPEGVPGAYRLFVNLLSQSRATK